MEDKENLKGVPTMSYRKKPKPPPFDRRRRGGGAPWKPIAKPPPDRYPRLAGVSPTKPSSDEAFKREESSFERLRRKSLSDERFKGKFIAVLDGKLVGCDEDDSKLAKRIYDTYGYRPIYIDKVTETRRTIEFPSPELDRK